MSERAMELWGGRQRIKWESTTSPARTFLAMAMVTEWRLSVGQTTGMRARLVEVRQRTKMLRLIKGGHKGRMDGLF